MPSVFVPLPAPYVPRVAGAPALFATAGTTFGTGGSLGVNGLFGLGGTLGSGGSFGVNGVLGTGGNLGIGGSLLFCGNLGTGGFFGIGGLPGTGGTIGFGASLGIGGNLGIGGTVGVGGFPNPVSLLSSDGSNLPQAVGPPKWGIYNTSGQPILTVDSVSSVEYARDYRISDYPQEKGAFMAYNKVQVPFQAKVGFLIGKSRFAFLNGIEAQLASLNMVSVITPEITYINANLTHYDFRRTSRNGVTLVLVTVWCEEVRVVQSTTLSNAQGTNQQPTAQGGSVQEQPTSATPGNLQSTLPPPSASIPFTSPNFNGNPNIGPAFYDASNLPVVPNSAVQLTQPQQGSTLNYGQAIDANFAQVSTPNTVSAPNTAIVDYYQGPF